MDKTLTKYFLNEELTDIERAKVQNFLARYTPWQRMVVREFYWIGPQYVEKRYNVDIYNMLTNMGILEVE